MRSLKTILLAEIGQQCRFALLAYAGATSAQKAGDAERFWYSLQSLLQAAANASLLLWPTGESRQALAREIRHALQVTEDSPLSPARFRPPAPLDEWLAEWAASVRHGEASLSNFGPGGFAPCTPSRYVRCFDPDESVFVFLGEIWDCASLVRALAEIQHQAEAEMERLKAIM
ncbi:MAG TPA: hypothetical protein VNN17_01945 [Terriglobia bacterium]|nr:hypothetical protein [Terriglobia bacterium]